MANEVKITLSADGSGLKLAVGDAQTQFIEFGKTAADAGDKATDSFSATRKGIVSISEQLKNVQATMVDLAKATAAVWAVDKVVAYAKEMATLNARYQELGAVMPVVGRNAGYTATEMNAAASSMQHAGISMLESRNTAIQLAQAQINLADASKLARIAQDAAVVGNMNSSEALNHMIYGIKSGQIEVLRTIGINVNFEQSYKAMAHQLGVSTEALTEHQKMQARENAVLEEGTKLTGAYEAAMGTAGKQMRSMARYTEDLKVMRGEVFNEALTVGVMAFVDQLKEANSETVRLSENQTLAQWGSDVADGLAFAADAAMKVYATFKAVGDAIGWAAAQLVLLKMPTNTKQELDAYLAARDAINEESRQRQAAYDKLDTMFTTSLEKRRATQRADSDAKVELEKDYAQRSLIVMQAYANSSAEIQKKAQLDLAKSMYPQEFPDKPKDKPVLNAHKGTGNAFEDQQTAMKEWEKAMLSADAAYSKATAKADGLSESEKALRDYMASSAAVIAEKLVPGTTALVEARYKAAISAEAANASAKAQMEYMESIGKSGATEVKQLEDKVAKQIEHNAEIGKTKEQIERYKQSVEDAATVELESQAQAIDLMLEKNTLLVNYGDILGVMSSQSKEIYELELKSLREQIDLRKKLSKGFSEGAVKEAGVEAEKEITAERKKGWEETDRLAREVFTAQEVSAQRVGDVLKKALKSAIYEATFKPIAFQIYSSVAGGAPGTAGGAGSGLTQTAGSFGASASTMLGSTFAGTAYGTGATLAGAGMGAEAFSAGVTMMGEATGFSSFMAGAGQALGAVPVIGQVALAMAVISALTSDKFVSASDSGRARIDYSAAGVGGSAYSTTGDYSQITTASNAANALEKSYIDVAKSLGAKAISGAFEVGYNTGAGGAHANTVIGANFGRSGYSSGEVSSSDTAAVQLAASRAVFAALQGSDLPGYMSKVFDGITAGTATQAQINDTLAYAQSLKTVRDALIETRTPLQVLQANVADGFATLGTSAGAFKKDFVAAIDAGIAPENLAEWQKLDGAMKQLAQDTGTATKSVEAIASERLNLQDQLDNATMNATELLNKQRNALDESNRGLFDQVKAQEKLNKQAADQISWQQKLDIALGKTTQTEIDYQASLLGVNAPTRVIITTLHDMESAATTAAAKLTALNTSLSMLDSAKTAAGALATQALDGVKASVTDAKNSAQAAYDATIKQLDAQVKTLTTAYDAAVAVQNALKTAAADTRDALSQGLKAERTAATAAYKSATDAIKAQQKTTVDAYKIASDAATKAITAASKSLDLIKGLDSALNGAMNFFKQNDKSIESRQSGQATLAAALADAQAGKFPTAESLADAIAAVTQPSDQFFSSFEDYQRDYFKTAINIKDLSKLTGTQLTKEEATLQVLQDTKTQADIQHQTTLDAYAAQQDALDLANETLNKLFDQRAESIAANYDSATKGADTMLASLKTSYDQAIANISGGKDVAKTTLEETIASLNQTLQTAQNDYDMVFGNLAAALLPLPQALKDLAAALGKLEGANAAVATAKTTYGNTAFSAADIKTAVAGFKATAQTGGADLVTALNQYALTNGLSNQQIVDSGALVGTTTADLTGAFGNQGLTDPNAVLAATGGTADTLKNAGLVAASSAATSAVPQYFKDNPDVALAYSKNSYGMTMDQFAAAHAAKFGSVESRKAPDQIKAVVATASEKIMAYVNAMTSAPGWTPDDPYWRRGLYDFAHTYNFTSAQVEDAMGAPKGIFNEWAAANNLPAFRQGANYIPQDMVAQIHKGEAIIPEAFNPAKFGKDSGNDALVAEIKALREQVTKQQAALEAIAINTNKQFKVSQKWDVDGLPATTTAV